MSAPRARVADLPEWLEELLFHPGRFLRHLLQLFLEFLAGLVPLAVALLVAVVLLLVTRRYAELATEIVAEKHRIASPGDHVAGVSPRPPRRAVDRRANRD